MKIHPFGAEFFVAERQTDMAKLMVSLFLQLCERA